MQRGKQRGEEGDYGSPDYIIRGGGCIVSDMGYGGTMPLALASEAGRQAAIGSRSLLRAATAVQVSDVYVGYRYRETRASPGYWRNAVHAAARRDNGTLDLRDCYTYIADGYLLPSGTYPLMG